MSEPVRCARPGCGVPFTVHGKGAFGLCLGFLWVEPAEEEPPVAPSVTRPNRPPRNRRPQV